MNRTFRQLVLAAFGGLFLLGTATTADAGFLVSSMNPEQEFAGIISIGAESSAPVDESPQPELNRRDFQGALFAAPTSGGMNSQSIAGSRAPTTTFAVAVVPPVTSPGQLEFRLACQREPYHPRFIKSRLFRPPRV